MRHEVLDLISLLVRQHLHYFFKHHLYRSLSFANLTAFLKSDHQFDQIHIKLISRLDWVFLRAQVLLKIGKVYDQVAIISFFVFGVHSNRVAWRTRLRDQIPVSLGQQDRGEVLSIVEILSSLDHQVNELFCLDTQGWGDDLRI